jgi:hypothetical protein
MKSVRPEIGDDRQGEKRENLSSITREARGICHSRWGFRLVNIIPPREPAGLAEGDSVGGEIAATESPSRKQDTSVYADPDVPASGKRLLHRSFPTAAGPR